MLIECTTKGCLQKTEAKLDLETNEVLCELCGNAIQNITDFTRKILKDSGQVLRNKGKQPFQVFCKKCNATRSLYLDNENRAYCKVCNSQVIVTEAFLRGLKQYLQNKE